MLRIVRAKVVADDTVHRIRTAVVGDMDASAIGIVAVVVLIGIVRVLAVNIVRAAILLVPGMVVVALGVLNDDTVCIPGPDAHGRGAAAGGADAGVVSNAVLHQTVVVLPDDDAIPGDIMRRGIPHRDAEAAQGLAFTDGDPG